MFLLFLEVILKTPKTQIRSTSPLLGNQPHTVVWLILGREDPCTRTSQSAHFPIPSHCTLCAFTASLVLIASVDSGNKREAFVLKEGGILPASRGELAVKSTCRT